MNQPAIDEADEARDRAVGRALVVAAALMWSTAGMFAKAPHLAGWPGPSLAFWRAVFASAVLLPLVRQPRWSWKMAPMVVCFVAMNYTFLTAMTKTEAANAIWLQNTAPIWVFLVSVFLFREPLHPRDIPMAICGAIGVGVILAFETRNANLEGIVYGLLAAFTYAGVVLSLRRLREYQSSWLIALNHLATAVVLAPLVYADFQESGGATGWPHGVQWPLLAGFGILQMGLPYVLFARGLKRIPGHEASGIVLLEPTLTPLWVFLAWSWAPGYESPRWWTLVGGGLILLGLAFRYVGANAAPKDATTAADEPQRQVDD
ncbi:MAG: EamA family transporter [Pirellulaceae bacterium]|jgi:drug/metabolite transporter (DMT)-like permease|nr:EamA family transporter [Pirellulaceae bacterium]